MSTSTNVSILAPSSVLDALGSAVVRTPAVRSNARPAFDDVYRDHFAFVWRCARRLGVQEAALDDVVQEVFMVVHRRLESFEGRSSLRTWLFGVTLHVVRDHRRAARNRDPDRGVDPDSLGDGRACPSQSVERAEAMLVLYALLDTLDDDKREVFVMAELEQMPMPEIATALGINVNTAYARLRAARVAFEQALARYRARDEWRLR